MILNADARAIPLAARSVHCVVTSPPYWGLRDYGIAGQLGLERTPEEYVAAMVAVFREVWRVLRDDGTLWLNLGDCYASSPPGCANGGVSESSGLHGVRGVSGTYRETLRQSVGQKRNTVTGGLKPKDLVGIPWRCAFALQAAGWTLRSDIVWSKPNPMPESVTDRPTRAHEYLFLLSKALAVHALNQKHKGRGGHTTTKADLAFKIQAAQACSDLNHGGEPDLSWFTPGSYGRWDSQPYYFDAEAIKEPAAYPGGANAPDKIKSPYGQGFTAGRSDGKSRWPGIGPQHGEARNRGEEYKDMQQHAGRNKRSVWTIATTPYPEAHFATFPEALVEPCILAGTSERGVCAACGAPWTRVGEKGSGEAFDKPVRNDGRPDGAERRKIGGGQREWDSYQPPTTTGWQPTCACAAPTTKPLVLDPFAGSGTVGLVCQRLGRRFVGLELKPEYCQMAAKRTAQLGLI